MQPRDASYLLDILKAAQLIRSIHGWHRQIGF